MSKDKGTSIPQTRPLREGIEKKGGVNQRPATPPPPPPKGQGGKK
jgi:hypothetical protein